MMEKQLSIEKCQLEDSVTSSNKEVLRMSQNVEELQWRIRNNFELPIIHHSREAGELGSPTSPLDSPIHHRYVEASRDSGSKVGWNGICNCRKGLSVIMIPPRLSFSQMLSQIVYRFYSVKWFNAFEP